MWKEPVEVVWGSDQNASGTFHFGDVLDMSYWEADAEHTGEIIYIPFGLGTTRDPTGGA